MDSEAPKETPRRSNIFTIFITSLSAAIVVAGGCAIVLEAAVLAAVARMGLGQSFLWAGTVINAGLSGWLALWTFSRSWHVERRLQAGLEVDEPKISILANFRDS